MTLKFGKPLSAALLGCGFFWAAPAVAQIQFQDVTQASGISYTGESYGVSWGDHNGDGRPDLWVSNHLEPDSLYQNQPDGTFVDIASQVYQEARIDTHGVAWGDIDNDGDQDLLVLAGAAPGIGEEPNLMLINENGTLVDRTTALGLDQPLVRGRTPLWFDWNGDARLDVVVASILGPGLQGVALYTQQPSGVFIEQTAALGLPTNVNSFFAGLTGVSGFDLPQLMIHAPTYPLGAYLYNQQPFLNISQFVGLSPGIGSVVQDAVIADFDGNLESDIFLARHFDTSDITTVDADSVLLFLTVTGNERGVDITTDGDLTITVSPDEFINLNRIRIGAGGANPASHTFTVSASEPSHYGLMAHTPGVTEGLYIGRDPVDPVWHIALSKQQWVALDLAVDSDMPISATQAVGFTATDGRQTDLLYLRSAGTYSDASIAAGLTDSTPCDSIAAEDFDNDMDIDVYLVCRGMTGNSPNRLLENQGNGTFVPVPLAGGAEGTTAGRGDTVVTADYDLDGFVDMYVTNGYDFGDFAIGPDQLFRNVGNGNHWLQVDLQGVAANRDAVGARVIAVAGGKFQVREQSGRMHRYGQNHSRLHFGLAANTRADALAVQWPNGSTQLISNIPADQIIQVVQPSTPSAYGQPSWLPGVDRGVYLWRDNGTNNYHLRVSGDANAATYAIRLVSAAPVTNVSAIGIDGNDTLATSQAGLILIANVVNEQDGVDFQLYNGVPTMISIERNGVKDPRDLHVGVTGAPLSPAGWIVDFASLPTAPTFTGGQDLGLFIGKNASGNTLVARWSGDAATHAARLLVLSNTPLGTKTAVGLEGGDVFNPGFFSVLATGSVGASDLSDGVDVGIGANTMLGISYRQDTLFQSRRVNPLSLELGIANAYRLP